jgi:drug/metabolite transporter (DMT)-like permease
MSVNTADCRNSGLPAVSYLTGVLMVLFAGICWSFIPIGVRQFTHATIWQILLFRSIGLLPMIWFLIQRRSAGQGIASIRAVGLSGIIGGLGLVAAYAGGIGAVRMTSIANAAFLFATAPFLAAFLGWFVLGEKLRRFTVVAMVLAVIGIVIMVSDSISAGHWFGDFIALLSALGFAVFTITLRIGRNGESLPVVFLGGLFAIICSSAVLLGSGLSFVLPLQEIMLALILGTFALGSGMVLYTLGSRVIPAGELALLCMTEVVLAPVWAWLFIREIPPMAVMAGGGVLIFAIVLNAVTGIRRKPVPVAI